MARVAVIDPSASVRETLAIILGPEHEVRTASALDDADTAGHADLVIAGLPVSPADALIAATALAALPPTTALLLLCDPATVAATPLAATTRPTAFLPKPFDGHALRRRVRALLVPGPPPGIRTARDRHVHALQHPFLSREAAALVQRALSVDFPLLFLGESGCGALEVARAVHLRTRPPESFRSVNARDLAPAEVPALLAPAAAGVFLEDVAALPRPSQHALLAALGDGAAGARLYASTARPLDEIAADGAFVPELAYALGVLTVHLAPLRDRTEDLDALIDATAARIAARLGIAPPAFSSSARVRLGRYLWFGNTAELEAVLARSMVVRDARALGSEDLLFLPEQARTPPPSPTADPGRPAPGAAPTTATDAARLEVLLGELAHELRNPLVTIKTFSQHLDSVLADPEVRARFTTLTAEAVTRMDTLLEHMLAFARFRAPQRTTTDLAPLIDQALAEQHEALTRKQIAIERNGARPGSVLADAPQVLFALRSLIGGLVPDLVAHQPLRMTAPAAGTIELQARAEPRAVARLASFVEGAGTESGETPTLPFVLAASLLERNGGSLRVRREGDGATVIRLTLAPAGP